MSAHAVATQNAAVFSTFLNQILVTLFVPPRRCYVVFDQSTRCFVNELLMQLQWLNAPIACSLVTNTSLVTEPTELMIHATGENLVEVRKKLSMVKITIAGISINLPPVVIVSHSEVVHANWAQYDQQKIIGFGVVLNRFEFRRIKIGIWHDTENQNISNYQIEGNQFLWHPHRYVGNSEVLIPSYVKEIDFDYKIQFPESIAVRRGSELRVCGVWLNVARFVVGELRTTQNNVIKLRVIMRKSNPNLKNLAVAIVKNTNLFSRAHLSIKNSDLEITRY